MKRLVVITVGKTHSGKTTFAKALEQQLSHSVVVDQDNHAEFINTFYRALLPKQGPNTIKYAVTKAIVDFAVQETDLHLIICNSNRNRKDRQALLAELHDKDFTSIIVHLDIPDEVLKDRVATSKRSTAIFRVATSFEEVLLRQQKESLQEDVTDPVEGEADHLFVIKNPSEIESVIQDIVLLIN